jgi:hypothetical protein
VKRGKAIRMGIETNSKTPAFPPRFFNITVLTPGQEYGGSLGETKTNYNDDIITGWVGVGSQLDGLGHIGIDGVYYNCLNGREVVSASGITKLGIETVPAIATRGVILDMVGLLGQDQVREVPPSTARRSTRRSSGRATCASIRAMSSFSIPAGPS